MMRTTAGCLDQRSTLSSSSGPASWLAQQLSRLPPSRQIVGVAGSGGLGKSALCRSLRALVPRALTLETDGYLIARDRRRELSLRGDFPESHDLIALATDLASFATDGETVPARWYDHYEGRVKQGQSQRGAEDAILLLDGTACGFRAVLPNLDRLIVLDAAKSVRRKLRRVVDAGRGHDHASFDLRWREYQSAHLRYTAPLLEEADAIIQVLPGWRLVAEEERTRARRWDKQ